MTDRALDETTSTLRTLRAPWIALAIAAPIFVSLVFIYPQGDFAAHMDIARALAQDGDLWTYSLWYPLQHALSIGSYNETTTGITAVVIALASITLKIYIAEWYARSEGLPVTVATIIALVVTFSMPAFDPRGITNLRILGDIYLGQLSPNVWHNSTTILSMPFSLLALIFGVRYLQSSTRVTLIALSGSMLVSTLFKPNFMLALVPTLFLVAAFMALADHENTQRWRSVVAITLALVPSIVILAAQYALAFTGDSAAVVGSTTGVSPLTQWRDFTDSIPISIIRSLLLPGLLTLLLLRSRSIDLMIVTSWVVLFISVAQFSTFSQFDEHGVEVLHGNRGWAIIPSMFALFLSTIVRYARTNLADSTVREAFKTREVRMVTVVALVHLISGLAYIVGITLGVLRFGSR